MQKAVPVAYENFKALQYTDYTGRGIILGRSETHLLQMYWISGRSASSRNRIFCAKDGRLRTDLADSSKEEGDASLLLYRAMEEVKHENLYIVSNGSHTDAIAKAYGFGDHKMSLDKALEKWNYEPDSPNHTQRITGMCHLVPHLPKFMFGIVRKSDYDMTCERLTYGYDDIPSGYGRCITTYSDNAPPGVRLPPFKGEPLLVPLNKSPEALLEEYWGMLNPEHRIAIAIKTINISNHQSSIIVHNRFERVTTSAPAEPAAV